MNRITRTTIYVARTDWAPYIEAAVRALATAAAFVYTCGYVSGRWLHNLNDRLSALLVRRERPYKSPAGIAKMYSLMAEEVVKSPSILYRCAPVVARCGIQAPRVHPAVTLRASGLSQQAIADKLGCTRYEVRKALKG